MAEPAVGPLLGRTLELDIGPVAAGGCCVARHGAAGRVVFVRHTLPGERVRVLITEDHGGSFCRGDAVEVLRAAPDRVAAPCGFAGPGRCGGCDWQHASGVAQRELKAAVIRDQFARIGGIDLAGRFDGVEELPGGLLGWRTRISYAVDADGRAGLRRHASHDIEPIDRCLLGAPGVGDAAVLGARWPGRAGIEVVRGDDGQLVTLEHRPGADKPRRRHRGRHAGNNVEQVGGPRAIARIVRGRRFRVAAAGFWQVHPAAAGAIAGALLADVAPAAGETVLELYAGAGALTATLAEAVGPAGRVLSVESDRRAVADAGANLAALSQVEVRRGRVDARLLVSLQIAPDVVVLDPPRAGAGTRVMAALAARQPRIIGYVSCDPGTLARDVPAAAGYRLRTLRAFDAYPMTHHVECLATLEPQA